MDLGCIDMGCVENPRRETSAEKENCPKECSASADKFGKTNRGKDVLRSSLTVLNKLTSQISKPSHRKTSPISWFPRKKIEPYLKRKIKMLQEVDGMCSTLDETLGDSNPHYSRVLREKIAIKEAAKKAMELRKAAMVEASWHRILQAARIESREAEGHLLKAEADAAEAFEAAREAGVIKNDIPDTARNHCQIETASTDGVSMTHNVSAPLETAFEVDKQVAAAVKAAFIKLASCPSISKDEFKELLRKVSENPDTNENYRFSDPTTECVSLAALESEFEEDNLNYYEETTKKPKKEPESSKFNMDSIVDMMLNRLCRLKEDELASLATIVATSGLSAALSEMGTDNKHENVEDSNCKVTGNVMPVGGKTSRRNTIVGRQTSTSEAELPSLDKFLVKRLTRLEREVLEAKNGRKIESVIGNKRRLDVINDEFPSAENKSPRTVGLKQDGTMVQGLGCMQDKHSQKTDKELKEEVHKKGITEVVSSELPSLDKIMVKHMTRLERDILEAKSWKDSEEIDSVNVDSESKENVELNNVEKNRLKEVGVKKKGQESYESLDKVLVKHFSRLEKEKREFQASEITQPKLQKKICDKGWENTEAGTGLDQILIKRKSKLELEKMAAGADVASEQLENGTKRFVSRREAREKELQAAWGGLSLGNSMRRHVSRLERDKADWVKAEEEERKRAEEE